MSGGYLKHSVDSKWDKPMVKSKGRKRYDAIDEWLYNPGLMCRSQGGEYVFIDTCNSWCNLASPDAMSRIVTLAGIDNVSTGQEKAMKSFNNYIIKRCNARVCKPLPTSVCIGTVRFEMEADNNTSVLKFHEVRPILETIDKDANPAVRGVCIMPIALDIFPQEYRFPGYAVMLDYLMSLFSDDRDAVTFMWHVGNCLVDPISKPKSVLLGGPGGTGKSTVLQQLVSCLTGCCSILPDGSLTSKSRNMSSEVSEAIVGSRMAVCFDVDLLKEELNMSVFKNISGSDYIRVGYNSCKTNCSLTLATNHAVNIEKQPEYLDDAIMRRIVVLHMNVDAMTIPPSVAPETNDARLDFACACIYIRSRYDFMPVRPMAILMTLCGHMIDEVVKLVEETSKPIDQIQGTSVVSILSAALKISTASVISKSKLISPMSVMEIDNVTVLRGLQPVSG